MAASRTLRRSSTTDAAMAEPRERILTAASKLFTQQGIARTGVDSLIAAAGVAKATFYRHFPAKEDLVVAWLRDPRTRWFARVRTLAETGTSAPAERIPRLFEAVATWLDAGDYRGCPYLNTAAELAGPDRPPTIVVREYVIEIGAYIAEQARLAGCREPERVGRELHSLFAGTIVLGLVHRSSAHALAAREAAVQLLR